MKVVLPGLYPRGEKLIAASRDFDRGRITIDELNKIREKDTLAFKELQKDFPYSSTGQLNWQDLLRPFADIVPGAKIGALTRFFETNTFWKILEFNGKANLDEAKLDNWMRQYYFGEGLYSKKDKMVFTLPFLYLFKEFSTGIDLAGISSLLEQILKHLMTLPDKIICFYEPILGWRSLTMDEKKAGKDFIEKIKKISQTPIIIYSSFFSLRDDSRFLFDLPVDGFGIDFYANPVSLCKEWMPKEKILLAGIISTLSTSIEPPEKIHDFIKRLNESISQENLFITTSSPAELIPRTVMDEKVRNIQKI